MNPGVLDARAELEAGGLTVKPRGETSLWICDTIREAGGVRLSNDASALLREDDRWIAVFPAAGMLSYEVPGELRDLVELIKGVYANYHRFGGPLKDAFARSVPDPERYLQGRFPAEDRPIPPTPTRRVEVGGGSRGDMPMIGGIDVRIPSMADDLSLEVAVRTIRQVWTRSVFENRLTGERYDSFGEIPFGEVEEIFVYRDRAAAEIWDAEGAIPEASNTMIHLIADPGWVTAVVDKRTGEMNEILAAIEYGLTSDSLAITAILMEAA